MTAFILIGAGRMGLPIVQRLIAAGHRVGVVDVNVGLQGVVEAAGADWLGTHLRVIDDNQILITVLPGSPELLEVALGSPANPAAMSRMPPGALWLDLTSAAPDAAATLLAAAESHGIRYVDAALGGGPGDARDGTLALYVGGDIGDVEQLQPIFEIIANPSRIHHMGANGSGYLTKLLVNALWFAYAATVGEVLLLGSSFGIRPQQLESVFAASPAASAFIDTYVPSLIEGDYLATFGIARVVEELDSLDRAARAAGVPWSVGGQVAEVHRKALSHFGEVDGELLGVAYLEHLARRTLNVAQRG
ncbi:MAG: hypothetical protein JWM76_2128 [Pseudonocardiales bacterium]|nr:hypothetical protein [Pseudonocardiales bacterium]